MGGHRTHLEWVFRVKNKSNAKPYEYIKEKDYVMPEFTIIDRKTVKYFRYINTHLA
jgi:hypothetical protein